MACLRQLHARKVAFTVKGLIIYGTAFGVAGRSKSPSAIYGNVLISELRQLRLADLPDTRGHNGCPVLGMTKFKMHAATDETALQHGASPGRTGNRYLNWFRTVLGMPWDKRVIVIKKHNLVAVMLGFNLQHSRGWQVVEEHTPFNFWLHEVAIHFITKVGMRAE